MKILSINTRSSSSTLRPLDAVLLAKEDSCGQRPRASTGLEKVSQIDVSQTVCKTPPVYQKVAYTQLQAFQSVLLTPKSRGAYF